MTAESYGSGRSSVTVEDVGQRVTEIFYLRFISACQEHSVFSKESALAAITEKLPATRAAKLSSSLFSLTFHCLRYNKLQGSLVQRQHENGLLPQ